MLDEEIAMTAANATAVADYWDWADALFMGMNPYARLGNVTGESKYHDQVIYVTGLVWLLPHPRC